MSADDRTVTKFGCYLGMQTTPLRFLLLAPLMCWFAAVSGQNGIIRGTVFDATTNDPIPFATVVLEGESSGASTDFDGALKFMLCLNLQR